MATLYSRLSVATLGAAFSLLVVADSGFSADPNLLQDFFPANPGVDDNFGFSVAISGDKVLIGVPFDDDSGENTGAAFLFDARGNLLQSFYHPNPNIDARFGFSVAIAGDKVLIGAPFDDDNGENTGVAFLFNATNGNLVQSFSSPNPNAGDNFGDAVAISDNNVLIGVRGDDTGGADSGAAFLFNATNGNLLHSFFHPNPDAFDYFGDVVDISGNKVLIGSLFDDEGAENSGAAFLFDVTSGNLLQSFYHPNPEATDVFGESIAISGDNVLVGSYLDDKSGENSGAAFLFNLTNGNLIQTFYHPNPRPTNVFGESAAISENHILIGSFLDDKGSNNSGAAFLFQKTDNEFAINLSETSSPTTTTPPTTTTTTAITTNSDRRVKPVGLVFLAYRGYLEDQGVPSYGNFIKKYKSRQFGAQDLVQAAINEGRLSSDALNDQEYIDDVDVQIRDFVRQWQR